MKKWFVVPIAALNVPIYLARHDELPEGTLAATDEGACDWRRPAIYVNAELAFDQKRSEEIAIHEILHFVLEVSGAGFMLLGGDDVVVELLIRMMSPMLHAALSRPGFCRIPPLPRTARASRHRSGAGSRS